MCLPIYAAVSRIYLKYATDHSVGQILTQSWFNWKFEVLEKVHRSDGVLIIAKRLDEDIRFRKISMLYLPHFGGGGFVETEKVPELALLLKPYEEKLLEEKKAHKENVAHLAEEKKQAEAVKLGSSITTDIVFSVIQGMDAETIRKLATHPLVQEAIERRGMDAETIQKLEDDQLREDLR